MKWLYANPGSHVQRLVEPRNPIDTRSVAVTAFRHHLRWRGPYDSSLGISLSIHGVQLLATGDVGPADDSGNTNPDHAFRSTPYSAGTSSTFAPPGTRAVHWIKRTSSARVTEYPVNDDVNLAIAGLKKALDDLKDTIRKNVPPPSNVAVEFDLRQKLLDGVDQVLAKFTADKQGIDNAWNDLFDPGDP